MMRKKIVIGNWKLNKNNTEAIHLAKMISLSLDRPNEIDVVLCPTAVSLKDLSLLLKDSSIEVGVQNIWHKHSGAFTGEISITTVKDLSVKYALVGHSERRQLFFETDDLVNKKIHALVKEGLSPILCVGESLEQRKNNQTQDHVAEQITSGLKNISPQDVPPVLIAYEPIWAIGTGETASSTDIESVHSFIRKTIAKIYDTKIAESLRILYGGSVKSTNAKTILTQPNVDGVLVGGASLSETDFLSIVRASH